MVGCGMQQFGPQPSEQQLAEVAHEAGVPVSNNLARHTVLAYHPLEEQVSSLGGSDGVMYRDKRDTLGGSICQSHCKGSRPAQPVHHTTVVLHHNYPAAMHMPTT